MINLTRLPLAVLTASIAIHLVTAPASAAISYWDAAITGTAGGGTGAWNATATTWSSAVTGGTNTAWVNGNDATFSGNPGTATLGDPITVGKLTFTVLGNTIATTAGSSLTLTNGITGNIASARVVNTLSGEGGLVMNGAQTIDLTSGLNITTALSGSGTLTKTGSAAVALLGSNTYTGKYVITAGFIGLNSDAGFGAVPSSAQADHITLNGGGILASGLLNGPVNFADSGAFSLNANRGITLGANGGTLRVGYGGSGSMTVNGIISGVGSLTKSDGGTVVLNGNNTYAGSTTVGGFLQVGTGGTTGTLGAGKIVFSTGGNFLSFNRSDDVVLSQAIETGGRANFGVTTNKSVTLSGAFSGTGELWKQGIGTLIVEANPASNRTSNNGITDGALQVSDLTRTPSSALGTGNLYFGTGLLGAGVGLIYTGGTVATDAFQSFGTTDTFIEVTNANAILSVTNAFKANGAVAGAPANLLIKRGAGALSFEGALDNTRMSVQVDGGTLLMGKTIDTAHAIGGTLILNTGLVKITAAGGDQIYDPSTVQMNGGTFDLNGYSEKFNLLTSGNATGLITNTAAGTISTLTLGTNNGSSVYAGKLQDGVGQMALVKNGTGALTFTGPTIVGGGVKVNNGRFIMNGSLTGGDTEISGSVVGGNYVGGLLGGTGILGNVAFYGGIISPGANASGAAIGKLTIGNLDMTQNGTFAATISTSTLTASLAEIQGNLDLGFSAARLTLTDVGASTGLAMNSTLTLLSYTGLWDGGTFTFGAGVIEDNATFTFGSNIYQMDYDANGAQAGVKYVTLTAVGVVPEPAASGLLLGTLAVLGGWRRRKSSRPQIHSASSSR